MIGYFPKVLLRVRLPSWLILKTFGTKGILQDDELDSAPQSTDVQDEKDDYFQTVETVSESNPLLSASPDSEEFKSDKKNAGKISFNVESSKTRTTAIPKIVNPTEKATDCKKQNPQENEEAKEDSDKPSKNDANEEDSRTRDNKSALKMVLSMPTASSSLHFRPGDKTTYLLGTVGGHILLVRILCVIN